MKKEFQISNPCSENWDKMQQAPGGKFCDLCSKKVYDLTGKTDEEIQLLLSSNPSVCGKIQKSRLYIDEEKTKINYQLFQLPFRKIASGIFIAAMFTSSLNGQSKTRDTLRTLEIGMIFYAAPSDSQDAPDKDREFYRPKTKTVKFNISGNKEIARKYKKTSILTLSKKYSTYSYFSGEIGISEEDISFKNIYVFEDESNKSKLFLSANSRRSKEDNSLDLNIDKAKKIDFNPDKRNTLYFLDGEEISYEDYDKNKNDSDIESYFLSEDYAEELLGKTYNLQYGVVLSYRRRN
ncbi:hypothetical protein [Chryseobacterium sp. OSA05B]|uniref:hypothetical protein n=1 Tax=Chryseobacterium sp. OSA05B TaxID=2862650 RepID=UPI001CBE4428|nr:hypothetical protein [Chryseobacterium sp. OSA05B]